MSCEEVVKLMGYPRKEYSYKREGYLCIPYPIDWDYQYSYSWVSFLFRDKQLISYNTFSVIDGCEAQMIPIRNRLEFERLEVLKRQEFERLEDRKKMPPAIHKYIYKVVDFKSNPIAGVDIIYEGFDKWNKVIQGTVSTDFRGEAYVEISTSAFPKYATNITYVIQKDEYLSKTGGNSIDTDGNGQKYETAQLFSMNDYFCRALIDINSYDILRQTVRRFLNQVILKGLLADSFLTKVSVCFETFKGKRYVSFTFASGNVYNSIKMDKYDMGKRLFDEVVRKVLGPMNDNMKMREEFNGYKLTLNAHTKSFLDKLSETEEVVYDFYLPKDAVSAYKEKDIAGQALLDRSIILMNDERVEFRLQ